MYLRILLAIGTIYEMKYKNEKCDGIVALFLYYFVAKNYPEGAA